MVDPITSAKKNLLNITALPAVKTAYTNMVAFVYYAAYDHEFVNVEMKHLFYMQQIQIHSKLLMSD